MSAFGHNMAPISKRKPKCLHCRDPRLVDNFIHLYHQFASPLKLFYQVQEFEQKAPFMSKTEVIHRYEELDALRCEATAFAERRCHKLRMGQVAFSPELNLSRLKIKAWLMLLAKVKKRKISSRLIKRTLKKANISSDARGLPEGEIQECLKAEYKPYYQLKGDATQLRMTALAQLAAAIAEKGDTDKEKVIKALREREQQRKTAKKIKFLQGKLCTGSTTMVTTTNSSGTKIDITNKKEMELAILESNKTKFTQSSHTPFYLHPLKDDFGFKGLTSKQP